MLKISGDKASEFLAIYQWWTSKEKPRVLDQTCNPILLSISTMRHHCPDIAIKVIDHSTDYPDWGDFPERFRFEVHRQRCSLGDAPGRNIFTASKDVHRDNRVFLNNLSRPLDVFDAIPRTDRKYIIYCDSDVLWNGSCAPAYVGNQIHCRPTNTGVFYFDKTSTDVQHFFYVWMGLSSLAARNVSFRRDVYRELPGYSAIHEEVIFRYILKIYPELEMLTKDIGPAWNLLPSDYGMKQKCRALHLMGEVYGKNRGYASWLLEEFQPIIQKYFATEEIETMFGAILQEGGKHQLDAVHSFAAKSPDSRWMKFFSYFDK